MLNRKCKMRGSVMIEFVIVFPCIFLIFLGTLEINQFIRVRQKASVFSREAATRALRRCSTIVRTKGGSFNLVLTQNNMQRCLNDVGTEIQAQLDANFPGSTVKLSLFRYLPNSYTNVDRGQRLDCSCSSSGCTPGGVTEYDLNDPGGSPSISSNMVEIVSADDFKQRGAIAAARIVFQYNSLITRAIILPTLTINPLFNATGNIDATIL